MAMTNFDQKEFTRNINILKRIIKTEHSIPDPYLNIAIGSIYYSLQKTKFDKNDEKLVEKIVSQIKSGDLDFDKFNKFLSDKNYETVSKESFDEMLNELLKPEN
jgi:cell pole-organizing protein PopZ